MALAADFAILRSVEQDWLLDEHERLRLIEPYRSVSPAWPHLGWSAFWAATGALTLATALFFSFSSTVEDALLIGAGGLGALSLALLATAVTVGLRHRRQMQGPYAASGDESTDPSTQIGTSRPARAM